jgi:hypothetical protein
VKQLKLDVATHGMTWGVKMLAAKKQAGVICSLTEWGEGITHRYLPGRTWRNPVVRAGVTTYRDLAESLGLGIHVKDGKASDWLNEVLGVFGIAPLGDISALVSHADAATLGLSVISADAVQETTPTDITPKDEIGVELAVVLYLGKQQDDAVQTDGNDTRSGGGCFVATAVFADPYSPEVVLLRKWREVVLRRSLGGRLFIRGYRLIGPHLARFVIQAPRLQSAFRFLLRRFIVRVVSPSLVTHFAALFRCSGRDLPGKRGRTWRGT